MFRYFIKGFIRSLLRRKLFSFINIAGLAFGIAFIVVIGQYIYFEYSYNSSIKNINNIYRLVTFSLGDYLADYQIKDMMIQNIPGVKKVALYNRFNIEINHGDNVFKNDNFVQTDTDFLSLLNPEYIYGNSKALENINSIIITESLAKEIFGSANVTGKKLLLNHNEEMFIGAVIKDLPQNLSIKADIICNYKNSFNERLPYTSWTQEHTNYYPFNIFVELDSRYEINSIEKVIAGFNKIDSQRYPEKVKLVPLKTNYFNTDYNDTALLHANSSLLNILALIGLTILLLAVINFINLTTAAYKYRLTEIGVKRCLGIQRNQLIRQFLLESFIMCVLASSIGIIIAEIILPYFNTFTEKQLSLMLFVNPAMILLFGLFVILLSLLTGVIPAFFLSKISPLQLFHKYTFSKNSVGGYRNILTIFQFSITIVLICSLIVMMKQIDYVKHKDAGFSAEKLLYLPVHHKAAAQVPALVDKLSSFHSVQSVSKTFGIPGRILLSLGEYKTMMIDSSAIKTFGFEIIKGRELLPGDFGRACYVNLTAWRELEKNNLRDTANFRYPIAGVISDFQFASLHEKNQPLMLAYGDFWGMSHLTLRINGSVSETISYIQKTWNELCPGYPLDYGFYDEYFAAQYKKEENLASLVTIFSVLAIVISCLGIFGLAFYQSQRRIKEIGIRKVLGASSIEITRLLTSNFIRWVLLANIFAWPVAYYFMQKWLESFAYRINLDWWIFASAGIIALLIAIITVSVNTIKAAVSNPVNSLKYE